MKKSVQNGVKCVHIGKTNLAKALDYYEYVLYMIKVLSNQPNGAELFDEFIKKNENDGRYMNWYDAPVHGRFDDVIWKAKQQNLHNSPEDPMFSA